MLYAYARIASVIREVKSDSEAKADYSTLVAAEKPLLVFMSQYWEVLDQCVTKQSPSGLCNYLYNLSKALSSWYVDTFLFLSTNYLIDKFTFYIISKTSAN